MKVQRTFGSALHLKTAFLLNLEVRLASFYVIDQDFHGVGAGIQSDVVDDALQNIRFTCSFRLDDDGDLFCYSRDFGFFNRCRAGGGAGVLAPGSRLLQQW